MKTLEQLGISTAPWRQVANRYGTLDVLGSDDSLVVAYENPIDRNDPENRRLIAAAPELYEALAAMLSCAENEAPFTSESGMSIAMNMARKAIKKAGGEE